MSSIDPQEKRQNENCSSGYLSIVALWQFGDWGALSEIDPDTLKNDEEREQVQVFKLISLLQLNKVAKAKRLLRRTPGLKSSLVRHGLLSSLSNTLARANIAKGSLERAQEDIISSVDLSSPCKPLLQVYRARMLEQMHQLEFFATDVILANKGPEDLQSFQLENTEGLELNRDITISFWLKVNAWPKEWTNVVGKLKGDVENEFCLRIKGKERGQFYCGRGGKAIVLNTWNPSNFIKIGKWAHIAVVKMHDEYSRLYVDGVIRSERDISGVEGPVPISVNVELLGSAESGRFLSAKIRNFQMFSDAFASNEVRALMLSDSSPTERVAITSLKADPSNLSPIERLELEADKSLKFQVASRVRSLDYYELIDALPNDQLTFVVVGANDGKYNDPLYEYLSGTERDNKVVLIEPQAQLLPYLKEHYSFHSNKAIINTAVGDEGYITLYGIKSDYWDQLDVPYAEERGWPRYRAPTGVASSSQQHVHEWLKNHSKIENVADAIEQFEVPSMSLGAVLEHVGIGREIDVLQIDAEGFDDVVIYRSDLETTKPKLIYFEVDHLDAVKKGDLYGYLESKGYDVYEACENTIAVYAEGEQGVHDTGSQESAN